MQEVNKQNNNKQENNRIDGNKKEDISDSNNIKKYEIPLDSNVKKDSSFNTVFIPRSAFNEDFKVTVSDMKEGKVYKGMYNAQDGYKFVIVSVSQQNLSNKVQLYTGKFSLYDNRGVKYDYIEGLSSYVLQILMPMGINFGTLVFEIPENSVPTRIVLETYGSTPIVVNLL
jgi:hypothetical protein